MNIKELAKEVHALSSSKGFHDGQSTEWTMLGNIMCEVAEAWEEARKGDFGPARYFYLVDGKPEGLGIELADVLIRVLDTSEQLGIDIEKMVQIKHDYNKTRKSRHGGKRV